LVNIFGTDWMRLDSWYCCSLFKIDLVKSGCSGGCCLFVCEMSWT
jgi:hypothetical protein